MQVTKDNKSETEVVLGITADTSFLSKLKDSTIRHLGAKHAKIPGFRPGTAPLAVIEKHVDPSLLQSEFLDKAINRLLGEAIKAERLYPIGRPNVQVKKFVPFTQLEFSAELMAAQVTTLANYKEIKKASVPAKVTAKDVDEVVKSLQKRAAKKTEVTRAAKNGDELTIDFKGLDDKKQPVSGADGKEYPLVLGSNAFIPGFEPNLLGLKPGGEKTFDVTFPKDYGVAALQNKKVTFTVKVHKIHELKEPAVDDAFAAQASPFKTLNELKDDIKKQLTVEKQREADQLHQNQLLEEIANGSKVAIPKLLVDGQIERAEQEERQNLAYRGQTWEEHLKEEGVSAEEHRERNRASAKQTVKISLLLSEIAERENVRVTPEELEIRLQLLKGQYTDPAMRAELDKTENQSDITNRLVTEKVIGLLTGYATK